MQDYDYGNIEPFREFERILDEEAFSPVPDDWVAGVSDIVDSTSAIDAGRYKAVNMAAASTITAVINALGGKPFPFTFAGDGARFVVPPEDADAVRDALSRTARWVEEELHLDLRVAVVPVARIREAGLDVRVARYAASSSLSYAMFTGGGMEWAEERVKEGDFLLPASEPGAWPDLSGLSCNWGPLRSHNGTILTVIAKPVEGAPWGTFAETAEKVLARLDKEARINPVPPGGPVVEWPETDFDIQWLRGVRFPGAALLRRAATKLRAILMWLLFRFNIPLGKFRPEHYRRQVSLNTDFRKFDDGLMMTVDCSEECADEIEAILRAAREEGRVEYGVHRQESALMTCVVPSVLTDDHLHFLDGGKGGYTQAARQLKAG